MKIDSYISELLYDHDCVIVTDLGGFITHYRPATINQAVNTISPPSKKLAFNGALKNNDGLLAYHISNREALDYAEATKVVTDYAHQAKAQMQQGKKVKIEKIGILFLDKDQNIQFLPDQNANYLIDSFGLTPIHAPVLKREVKTTQSKEEPVTIFSAEKENPVRSLKIFKWKVLEVIPAAAILAILLLVPPALDKFNTNMSSLLPFSRIDEYVDDVKGVHTERVPVIINYPNPFEIPPAHPERFKNLNDTNVDNESTEESLAPADNTDVETTAADVNTADNNTTDSSLAEAVSGYHIIGGCFQVYSNAENLVAQLEAKNIHAEIIGQNHAGLYMVSLYHSTDFSVAKDELEGIKNSAVATAWIYRK